MDRYLPWIAIAITVGGLVFNAGRQASALQAATDANASSMQRHEAQENRISELDDRVDYLCNERRRDNQEAGRIANGGC